MQSSREFLRLLGVAVIFAFLALAQDPADQSVELTGTVTNSVTGEPIPRARVTALHRIENGNSRQKYSATTTAEGKFSIENLAPGHYFVMVERVGFTTAFGSEFGGPSVTLRPGEQHQDIAVKLTPCAAISGRVLDANGEPMDSVRVTVDGGNGTGATTDEKGQFRIGGLAPGKYRLKAVKKEDSLPPEIRSDGTVEVHYAATYYPSKLEVQPGTQLQGIEIQLNGGPVVGIRGKVIGIPPGTKDVLVFCAQARHENDRMGQLNSDGTFVIWRMDPGRYYVSATGHAPNGHEFWSELATVDVAGSNVDQVELKVVPAALITGHLQFDDEKARQIVHSSNTQAAQVFINGTHATMSTRAAKIDDNDSFLLEDVQPGHYQVGLSGIEGVYVRSMRVGQTEIAGAALDWTHSVMAGDGAGGAELVLSISSATGSVSGTVHKQDGNAAGVRVQLMHALDGDNSEGNSTQVNDKGSYLFSGLRPGKYKLLAIDGNILERDWFGDYEELVLEVEIRAGETTSQDLTPCGSAK